MANQRHYADALRTFGERHVRMRLRLDRRRQRPRGQRSGRAAAAGASGYSRQPIQSWGLRPAGHRDVRQCRAQHAQGSGSL